MLCNGGSVFVKLCVGFYGCPVFWRNQDGEGRGTPPYFSRSCKVSFLLKIFILFFIFFDFVYCKSCCYVSFV